MTPYTTRKFSQKGGISVFELCKEPRYAHYFKYGNKMKGGCSVIYDISFKDLTKVVEAKVRRVFAVHLSGALQGGEQLHQF